MRPKPAVVVLAVSLLAGCASGRAPKPAAPVPSPAAAAVPADDDLNAVLWTQRAVEHDLVFEEVYRSATEKLPAALADPTWDALPRDERTNAPGGLPPAVIFDVDEAVLDNSPYEAQLIRSGEEYNEFTWAQWCHREAARVLPGVLEFVRFAAAHGVRVFYVTNRAVDLTSATAANLRKAGLPLADPGDVLGLGTVVPGCETFGTDKGCRRRFIGRNYRVLMQFGDQIGDFLDVVANTLSGRGEAMAPYASWIGERWFVLPNPTYGSWEPACFNNDWRLPREQRRAEKIKALRVD